jgi:pumilio homology domain family member 6
LIFLQGSSSREAHAKQKVLAQERKAVKPNADSIARSKKIWERLRRKSHVPKEERKELVTELFAIISSRVKDFVFKHDSVRVIQTAVKYGNLEQRRQIARELKGEYRGLAESRYAKFLIAKLVVKDDEIRDMIIPEFYGHVRRLIRHPEAAWIMDDIYRTIATPEQKSRLLREWYGHEFVIFPSPADAAPMADLHQILLDSPEKRGPIMKQLKEMTNQLVQKKTTGFTMLHDALLQYFINCAPGGPEAAEVIELLKDDEDGDCLKNLAFTKSGARLVCLAIAYSSSKDRRTILKVFKGVMKLLAGDSYGHWVLLTAFDVIDDTVMTAKAIFPELLCKDLDEEQRQKELVLQVEHLTARIPYLYLLSPGFPKWLLPDQDISLLKEIQEIRKTTSKKDAQTRREELIKPLSPILIDLVSQQTEALVSSSFGCQFINEVMFGAVGEKEAGLECIASLAKDKPELMDTPHAGRLLKSLVQGGPFDRESKEVRIVEPPLRFGSILYSKCGDEIVNWALGAKCFTVIAMLESPHMGQQRGSLVAALRGQLQALQKASRGADPKRTAGARILLQELERPC